MTLAGPATKLFDCTCCKGPDTSAPAGTVVQTYVCFCKCAFLNAAGCRDRGQNGASSQEDLPPGLMDMGIGALLQGSIGGRRMLQRFVGKSVFHTQYSLWQAAMPAILCSGNLQDSMADILATLPCFPARKS